MFENKKKYIAPDLEVMEICNIDIITTSPGTDAPLKDDPFGEWEL